MKPIFVILTVVAVATLAGAPVSAQADSPSNQTAGNASVNVTVGQDTGPEIPEECSEQIDSETYLCSASTDGDTVTLSLYSLDVQTPTFTDAGGFMSGGVVYQQENRLYPDRKTSVVIPVTESDGFVGVSIATSEVLYAVPLKEPSPSFLPGRPSVYDAAIAGATVFAMFAICLPGSYWLLRKFKGGVHHEL